MASFDSTFDGQHGIATTMGATTKPRRTTTATKITRSGISLGAEQKVQLIEFVHQRPQIWDTNCEGFRSNQSRQNAFNEVAQLLSNDDETLTRIQVQEEWGKLRYCFTRIVKKLLEETNGPDGQISEAQIGTITWPYFQPMGFLLDGVATQLRSQSPLTATAADGEEGAQENAKSDTSTKPKHRRRRMNLSRKSSHDYIIEQNQSTVSDANELFVNQMLGINAQELLMATLNNSHQLLNQFNQQPQIPTTPKILFPQKQEEGAQQQRGQFCKYNEEQNPIVVDERQARGQRQQQREREEEEQKQQHSIKEQQKNDRRKRKGSNLDFLLGSSTAKTTTHPLGISMSMPSARITSMYMSPARSIESSHESRSPKLCIDEIGTTNDVEGEMEEGEGRTSANRSTGTITAKLDEDINESFGHYIVQQLKTLTKKSELLGAQLRKELVDVCYKYEIRGCKISDTGNSEHPDPE